MPKQNRVTPLGGIIATPERGLFMGNRGVLHDSHGRITKGWVGKRWIICLLEFKGRRRPLMSPGKYTELFFLDEAVALAAGHRPCAECRKARFLAFAGAWSAATGEPRPTAPTMDSRLHVERTGADAGKRPAVASADNLPDGVFVQPRDGGDPCLIWRDRLLTWTAAGYRQGRPRETGEEVLVLTPESTVRTIRAGYVPEVHGSADSID